MIALAQNSCEYLVESSLKCSCEYAKAYSCECSSGCSSADSCDYSNDCSSECPCELLANALADALMNALVDTLVSALVNSLVMLIPPPPNLLSSFSVPYRNSNCQDSQLLLSAWGPTRGQVDIELSEQPLPAQGRNQVTRCVQDLVKEPDTYLARRVPKRRFHNLVEH